MNYSARGHLTLNAAATSLGSYRELVLRLCALSGVAIVRFEGVSGVSFIPEAELPRLKTALAVWRERPQLKIHQARKTRARRPYNRYPSPGADEAAWQRYMAYRYPTQESRDALINHGRTLPYALVP